jgi:tryptophanyl-tRNA synthetase
LTRFRDAGFSAIIERIMAEEKKVLLSGVKPTGTAHIGNYFGAMRQFVEFQKEYETFIMIADYHALTSVQDKEAMARQTLDLAIDYLAIGLDPARVTLFKQSDVPAHTELAWIFNCITTMPYLSRAHAFKDAEAKNKEINVGVFDYPMLMAADILLYGTDVVPVGADQKQHIEIARDTAETFKPPEPLIMEDVKTIIGTDGRKMSKSYGNIIPLFADDREIKSAVMRIPTDSKGIDEPKNPEECNVFALHKLFSTEELSELKRRYVEGGIGYQESKEILVKNMTAFIAPLREKRETIAADEDKVREILKRGGAVARERAGKLLTIVREHIGVVA